MTRSGTRKTPIRIVVIATLTLSTVATPETASAASPLVIDYAESHHVNAWLQDTVFGGPSFDAFERLPGNPVHTGTAPYEWPVNGSLFRDPVSKDWFAYIGEYTSGYIGKPARAIALRSRDNGVSWKKLGPVLEPNVQSFDKGGVTPDVTVVYDAGRFHMIYDWGELDFNKEGGIAYASADKPEGPWRRASQPITRNSELPLVEGRYRRTYAATLIKRQSDWLITGMMDDAPRSWTLFVMTAKRPEGPYTQRKLVRSVRDSYFHPPLMEFFPSFVHDGFLYAPATSVARNRNMQVMFKAPIEQATDVGAWKIAQFGSMWHSANVPHEYEGLWGQTFAGQVDDRGQFLVAFPSRDANNIGTIGIAQRPWKIPFRKRGFVVNAHGSSSMAMLKRAYGNFALSAQFELTGAARIIWDYTGTLEVSAPQSDAEIAAESDRCHNALDVSGGRWGLVATDAIGKKTVIATGTSFVERNRTARIVRSSQNKVTLSFGGREVWQGSVPRSPDGCGTGAGIVGWWLAPRSHLKVDRFAITGAGEAPTITYGAKAALLGAGETIHDWTEISGASLAFKSTRTDAMAKWNVSGRKFTLWSPRGPDLGVVEISIDGHVSATVDLKSEQLMPSQPIWVSKLRIRGNHAVVLRSVSGVFVVDQLQVGQ